ncbi:CPBP family intramembrane glutamic endopeptidase [Dyella sp. 20L07]|uniref:CPBP family intramembrane glutamic endopeptidase n=1 Tax=Dyella sp. 20L07 TaxID=3384240 RepID=UPI003D2B2400
MIATIAIVALVLWLVIAEPLLGRRSFQQLSTAIDAGIPDARLHFYYRWTWQGWLLVAIALVVSFGICGWIPAQLGWRMPADMAGISSDFITGFIGALVAGSLIGAWLMRRAGPVAAPKFGNAAVIRLLPRTRRERMAFACLAVTAGIGEEVVWRGFGFAAVQHFMPGASLPVPDAMLPVLVLILAVPFGVAHAYQGWAGVLVTGVIGAVMAGLYLGTGSLLLPILLHTLIDLRALLIPVPPDQTTPFSTFPHAGHIPDKR